MDQATLKGLIHYDPETGIMRNLKRHKPIEAVSSGYRVLSLYGVGYKVHRLAWFYIHGTWPVEIDHINRDRLDNRLINLRAVSRLGNMQNKSMYRTNTTGIKGVSQHPGGLWVAYKNFNGRRSQKFFKTMEEAVEHRRYLEML